MHTPSSRKLLHSLLLTSLVALLTVSSAFCDSVEVLKVVDGDTLRVRLKGKNELVRLIGIDTPEATWNQRTKKQADWYATDEKSVRALGERVTNVVRTMVRKGDTVRLEYDPQRRDHYGRVLAWVFLPNGKLLNEELLRLGYAFHLTKPKHYRYAERLQRAAVEGKAAERGLWASVGGQRDGTRQRKLPGRKPASSKEGWWSWLPF